MGDYRNLRVWNDAIDLTETIYKITRKSPFSKDFGLCNQIQRASVSVASNIAEGSQRWSIKEAVRFYSFASGSVAEVITQLHIANRINYLDEYSFKSLEDKAEKINASLKNLILSKKRSVIRNP